jgi:hypothetical protein
MNAFSALLPAKYRACSIESLESFGQPPIKMPTRSRIGRTRLRRGSRTTIWERGRGAPPLKKLPDQGGEAELSHDDVAASDRPDWTDSFLTANRDELARLAIGTSIRVKEGRNLVVLTSSDRLGAIPLRSPFTRKITGGLLVEPRFGWLSIGQVLGEVGFRVEPQIGGLALVPGSAREVPPWVLAGPLVSRVAALVARMSRTFVPTRVEREIPRGTVDWNWYANRALPTGRHSGRHVRGERTAWGTGSPGSLRCLG